MTAPEITNLLWLDLETTGEMNPRDGEILEVGVVLTSLDLLVLESRGFVLGLTVAGEGQLDQHPMVREMHTANGLLQESRESLLSLPEVSDRIVEMLVSHRIRPRRTLLAGSGISHFDRAFIQAQMPRVEAWLAYPNLDIGVLRRCLKYLGDPSLVAPAPASYGDGKAHRALADAVGHLGEARGYRALLQGVIEGFGGPDGVTRWWTLHHSEGESST